MKEDIDRILSRGMKNWAAHDGPPLHGKERLLEAAALPQGEDDPLLRTIVKAFFVPARYNSVEDGLLVNFGYSRTWSLHISSTFHMFA